MNQAKPLDEQIDHTPLIFGVYKGHSPSTIAGYDPGYLIWVYENIPFGKTVMSKLLYDDCSAHEVPFVSVAQRKIWAADSFTSEPIPQARNTR